MQIGTAANQERGVREAKSEDKGGRPAAETGVDRQRQQAWPIRKRGTGVAIRRETPIPHPHPQGTAPAVPTHGAGGQNL